MNQLVHIKISFSSPAKADYWEAKRVRSETKKMNADDLVFGESGNGICLIPRLLYSKPVYDPAFLHGHI